jgi:hypothetical protein
MEKIMKTFFYITSITIITFFIQTAHSQTCLLEAEIPSTSPDSRFANNLDGTITDVVMDLMWHRCQLGRVGDDCEFGNLNQYNWQEAFVQADSNSLADYNDWRLPNRNELASLIEHRCFDPAINTNFFPNTSTSLFWTSTPYTFNAGATWYVGFSQGSANVSTRNSDNYIRLVRSN